ncbi:hypothetical protein WG66_006720, partial [Moniliophthora roreri]
YTTVVALEFTVLEFSSCDAILNPNGTERKFLRKSRSHCCGLRIGQRITDYDITNKSPVPDAIFESNDPLLPCELDAAKQKHAEILCMVSSLNVEVSDLYAMLKAVASERQRLKTHLHKCKSILHPILQLPNDILAQIFQLCVDKDISEPNKLVGTESCDPSRYPGSLDTKKAPWVFTHVCRRWRVWHCRSPNCGPPSISAGSTAKSCLDIIRH